MGTERLKKALRHLRRDLLPPDGGALTDGQLLARFVVDREEAAFAALLHRHGPMVLGVCHRILGHVHDAEDAFQATFLVLVRKAGSVVKRESVATFLYGVAFRTAVRAKVLASRRRATERQMENVPHPVVGPAEAQDWRPLLDHELGLLPAMYRETIILCDLEGKTRRQAAGLLGLSEGTLSSRLARARCLLARRLARQGVTLSGGALAVALSGGVVVPHALAAATVQAATLVAVGHAAPVAASAVVLMKEVLKEMLLTKLKLVVTVVLAGVLLGGSGLAYRAVAQSPAGDKRAEVRPLSDLEMLRREVEILKLQVDLLQQKVRAQEVVLKSQADQAKAAKVQGATAVPAPKASDLGIRPYQYDLPTYTLDTSDLAKILQSSQVHNLDAAALARLLDSTRVQLQANVVTPPDPLVAVEKALKALREVKGSDASRQAADELEKALKSLRDLRLKSDYSGTQKPK